MTEKYIKIVLDSTAAKNNADKLSSSVENVGEAADMSNIHLKEMSTTAKAGMFAVNKLALAVSAVITTAALKNIATMVQEYQAMSERIKMVTKSTEDYNTVQKRLMETADGTFRSLAEAQEIFLRTESSLEGLGYTLNQQIDIIDSMSYAFVRNATSSERAEIAINSFGRAMAKGRLDADAWEMILIAIPTVVEDIAKSTGKTEQAIRELGSSGDLALTDLTEAFRKSREENKKFADSMQVNLVDAAVRGKNAITNLFVAIENDTGLIKGFTKGIIAAAESLNGFASGAGNINDVLDITGDVLLTVAAIITGKLLSAMVSSTAQMVSATLATRARLISENELAIGIQRRAVAEAEGARITLEAARADLQAANAKVAQARALAEHTQGTAFLNLALKQQLIAQEQVNLAVVQSATAARAASAANVALASSSNAVSIGATLASRAVGLLGKGLAFLGGPVGVAFLAAAAILHFATQTKEAINPTDLLTQSIEDLTDAQKDLIRLNIGKSIEEQSDIMRKTSGIIATLNDRLKFGMIDGAENIKEANDELIRQKAKADEARIAVEKLTARLAELDKKKEEPKKDEPVTLTPDTTPKDDINVQKEINDMIEKENKQMEMFENEKRGAASVTAALKMELANRQLASDNYRKVQAAETLGIYEQERILIQAQTEEQIAEIDKRQAEDSQRREEQMRQAVDHEELEQWQIAEIRQAYREQELVALDVYEQQRTAIQERAAQNRKDVDELERKARINSFVSMGSALMALGEGQSKKVFETGKTLALASAAVALPSAVLESYNNSGGYPWGIPAAVAMGAVGLKQISDIKNARFGSTPSSSSQSAAPTPEAAPTQGGGAPAGNFTVAGYDPRSLYTGEQLQGLGTALQDWWKNGGGDGTIMYQGA